MIWMIVAGSVGLGIVLMGFVGDYLRVRQQAVMGAQAHQYIAQVIAQQQQANKPAAEAAVEKPGA